MKKHKDLHTKDWTLNRILYLLGLLAFEIFCILYLILCEQQVIFSIVFIAFAVASLVNIINLIVNYKRKRFKTLIEQDIEEDMIYAEKYGDAYYMWKAYTLPQITKGELEYNEVNPDKIKLDFKDEVIIERGLKIKDLEARLKEINDKTNTLLKEVCELYLKNRK